MQMGMLSELHRIAHRSVQVLMMRRMLLDVFVFFCLLVLMMLAYGIAIEALVFPFRAFDTYTVLNVVWK